MKVIDLLNKIANGEEVPDNIEYENEIYYFSNDNKAYYNSKTHHILECIILKSSLNDEIIEEDKKIEKLENEKQFYSYRKYADIKNDIDKILYIIKGLNLTEEKIDNLNNKINEIIDYINGGTNGE